MKNGENNENITANVKASARTKRSLIQSLIALFSCALLLIGATFAWFTDSVEIVNEIQSGSLELEVTQVDPGEGTETPVDETTNLFSADFNWEPGAVQVVQLKVKNVGDLSLQYKIGAILQKNIIGVNALGEDLDLTQYIKFKIIMGKDGDPATRLEFDESMTRDEFLSEYCDPENDPLLADYAQGQIIQGGEDEEGRQLGYQLKPEPESENEHYVTLVAYMDSSVGNEANYRTVNSAGETVAKPYVQFGINIKATQLSDEIDSFGDGTYDTEAWSELDNILESETEDETGVTETEVEDPF